MKHHRLLLGISLLLLLFSLLVYYHLEHNYHIPDPQYILDHPEDFINTKVFLSGGKITNVDTINHTLLVRVTSAPDSIMQVTTTEPLAGTQPGDVIEMYGTLTSRNQLDAESVLIFEQWKNTLIYVRSLPAIPFALYLLFHAYRFNTVTFRFERRKHDG